MRWSSLFARETLPRVLRRASVRWTSGVLLLAGLVWLAAVRGIGMGLVVPAVLHRIAPDGWSVQVGEAEGDWRSRLDLHDVELAGPGVRASVSEVQIRFHLVPLLSRTIDVPRLILTRPRGELWPHPARPERDEHTATPATSDSTGLLGVLTASPLGGWRLRLGDVSIRKGRLEMLSDSGRVDVKDAHVSGRADLTPSGLAMDVDSLSTEIVRWRMNESHPAAPARLSLSAGLHDGLLDVRQLALTSPRSHVKGRGTIALRDPGGLGRVDFRLRASPLDVRDLPLTLPAAVLADPTARATVTAEGAGDSVVVEAETRGPAGLGARLRATLRPHVAAKVSPGDSVPALDARLEWTADFSRWAAPRVTGHLSGRLDATLDRLAADAGMHAHGTVERRPPAGASVTSGALAAVPLRADFDVTRPEQATDRASLTEAAATLYRAGSTGATAGSGWRRLGSVGGRVAGQHADWRLDLRLDSASAGGRGRVSWGGDPPRLTVEELDIDRLDASTIAVGLPETSISGRVRGHVEGLAPRRLSGDLELDLARSSVGERALDSLAVRADLTPGSIHGALTAIAGARRLGTDYRVSISDTIITARLTALRLTTASDSVGSAPPPVDVRARATGTWALGRVRRAAFDLTLDSSRLSAVSMSTGHVRGRIVRDSVSADAGLALLRSPAGPLSLTARLRGSGLAPSRWMGAFEASAVRRHAGGPVASARADETVDTLALTATAGEPGRFAIDGRFRPAEGGLVRLHGRASADSVTSFDLAADGALPDSVDLLDGATIDSLAVTAAGARDSLGWHRVEGRVALRDARWKGLAADTVRAKLRSDSSGLILDTLSLVSNVVLLEGSGQLPSGSAGGARGDLKLRGRRLDLRPLQDLSPVTLPAVGNSDIRLDLAGALDSLELSGTLSLEALAYESGPRVRGLDLRGHASMRPPFDRALGVATGTVDLHLDRLALPAADVRSVDLELEGGPDSLRLAASAQVDDDRSGEMHLRIDPRPQRRAVQIERVDLRLGQDRWHLREPARFSYLNGYQLDSFVLEDGSAQAIRIEGGVDAADSLDLRAEVDSTSVNTVADLLGFPSLRGWIDGVAHVEGTTISPRGHAQLTAGFGNVGATPATADLTLDAVGDSLTGSLTLEGPAGGRARARGTAPLRASGTSGGMEQNVDVVVSSDALRLSLLLPFLPQGAVSDLDGRLDADVTVHGPPGNLQLDGPASVRDGRIRLPRLGVAWKDVDVSARGSGRDLVLDTARATSGSGSMMASGRVSFSDSVALDVGARFDDFDAVHSDAYQAEVSGQVHAGGTVGAPVVNGRLQVESLDVYLGQRVSTSSLEHIELSDEDLRMLRERFGYVPESEQPTSSPLQNRLTADLVVELGRDSWVRKRSDPELAVAFTGDVNVRLRPGKEPVLDGSVQTIEGRGFVEQFGRRFDLREGTVTFDGPPATAAIDLSATYTIPSHDNPDNAEATIVLGLTGTPDSLSLALSSEPQMENADIVSYIATGRPASGSLSLGADSTSGPGGSQGVLVAAGESLALGQLTSIIEGTAERTVGLDVVQIRRQGLREATLVAGKYVSPRLYVGFAQPITVQEGDGLSLGGQGESEVEIELEALRWLLLNVEGSGSALRAFLRVRHAY